MNSAYHCGFFLTIWDKLFDTCYPQDRECFCAECGRYVRVSQIFINFKHIFLVNNLGKTVRELWKNSRK